MRQAVRGGRACVVCLSSFLVRPRARHLLLVLWSYFNKIVLTYTHTTTTTMNTVFSKVFFFLLLVVGGSVNLASYGGLSSSLRLGPVGALASTAPKDMPLSDLPEEFWFNDVSGKFMHARHATSSTYCSPRRSPSAP